MLTGAQYLALRSGSPGHSEAEANLAASWALQRVHEVAGLEYKAGDPLVARWEYLIEFPLRFRWTWPLGLLHNVGSVVSFEMNGGAFDGYRLRGYGLDIQNILLAGSRAKLVYYPEDLNAARDSVQALLMDQWFGRRQQYAAAFDGASRPTFDSELAEMRLLRDLNTDPTPSNLPYSTVYMSADTG